MPVIVVGADTSSGREIVAALTEPLREVRAFVSDPDTVTALKQAGVKVALGDVSDDSHIEGAALGCFTAVLVEEAASDARERSFASSPEAVLDGWSRAVVAAGVKRAIWVARVEPSIAPGVEQVVVHPDTPDLVSKVVALDDAQKISGNASLES